MFLTDQPFVGRAAIALPVAVAALAGHLHSEGMLTQDEVADRVEQVLREAGYLEMEGTIQQFILDDRPSVPIGGLEPVTFRSRMAEQRFRTDVYRRGELIAAFSLVDGRVQEYRPDQKDRPLLEYDVRESFDDLVSEGEFDCLVGSETYSWVSLPEDADVRPVLDRAGGFASYIREGRREADAEVQGHECYVYRKVFPPLPGWDELPPQHALYIDKESFIVRRWDTLHQGVQRIRLLQNVEVPTRSPDDASWRITAYDEADMAPVKPVALGRHKGWFQNGESNHAEE